MPCDTIQTANVALEKAEPDLLGAALAALGVGNQFIRYDAISGQVVFRKVAGWTAPTTAQIKQAYSAQVVLQTAKKFGWQVKETGKFQYAVTKR